jgi:hypothetical protein
VTCACVRRDKLRKPTRALVVDRRFKTRSGHGRVTSPLCCVVLLQRICDKPIPVHELLSHVKGSLFLN